LKFAILIHILGWDYHENSFTIDKDISFIALKDSMIEKLYHNLCTEKELDYGQPYVFNTALMIQDFEDDHSTFPSASPQSLSSIFLNLLTIINGASIGHCRIISSKDDFISSWATYELYDPISEGIYNLNDIHIKMNEQSLFLIKKMWRNLKTTYSMKNNRIDNALTFYYFSWHSHSLEQTAISLSIVIEALFSPDSNTELSHQIAFNIAKFMEIKKEERMEKYKFIKKYYSIRSKLVHGETINNAEFESIPAFFEFISKVLLKILTDPQLTLLFNDNILRKNYLKEKLFE
jgi:hypothetical protein